jgi:hypothetical protein
MVSLAMCEKEKGGRHMHNLTQLGFQKLSVALYNRSTRQKETIVKIAPVHMRTKADLFILGLIEVCGSPWTMIIPY